MRETVGSTRDDRTNSATHAQRSPSGSPKNPDRALSRKGSEPSGRRTARTRESARDRSEDRRTTREVSESIQPPKEGLRTLTPSPARGRFYPTASIKVGERRTVTQSK